jgi:hypothetical protein
MRHGDQVVAIEATIEAIVPFPHQGHRRRSPRVMAAILRGRE